MGLSHDRSYKIYESYRTRLGDLYSTARHFCMTHEMLLERRTEMMSEKQYARLPDWRKSMLSEFTRCKLDEIHRHHLTWTHVIDGVRVASKDPRLEGRYGELNSDESHHMWSHDLSKPF